MPAPYCCCRAWRMDASGEYVAYTSLGVFQYVVLQCLLALVAVASSWAGVYCAGTWSFASCTYPYVSLILNASQLHALYCLFLFFHDLWAELAPLSPLFKIASIKMVVFVMFWQAILISALAHLGVLTETTNYTAEQLKASLNSFLVCAEMLFFAAWFHCVFSAADFEEGSRQRTCQPPGRVLVFSRELLPDGSQGRAIPLSSWEVLHDILPHDLFKEARHHHSYFTGAPSAKAEAGEQQPGGAPARVQHSHPGLHGHSHGYSAQQPLGSPAGAQPPRTTDYL